MRSGKKALLILMCSLCSAAMMALWPVKPILEVEAMVIEQGALIQSIALRGVVCRAQETPYISPKDGIVQQVNTEAGDMVQKGQLLFKLDTTAEEEALSQLYKAQFEQRKAIDGLKNMGSVVTAQNALEWRQLETQLLAAINASYIRAQNDGVMGAVYVEEGSRVPVGTPLGKTHGTGIQIAVIPSSGMASLVPGETAMAYGESGQNALVHKKMVIEEDETVVALFEPAQTENADLYRIGESVDVELLEETNSFCALMPLSAITADETVWVIRDGCVFEETFQMKKANRTYAAASVEWTGQTVILNPECYDLKNGRNVQVKK